MTTNHETSPAPQLPSFNEGEVKQINLAFSQDPDTGVVKIELASLGMDEDLNQMALFLDFTLEKLLESESAEEPDTD